MTRTTASRDDRGQPRSAKGILARRRMSRVATSATGHLTDTAQVCESDDAHPAAAPVPAGIDAILADGDIQCLFQPIVDLTTGEVVAHEALARGPEGPLHTPYALFAAAREANRLADLDELCRLVAVQSAINLGDRGPRTLFLNIEPGVLRLESLDTLVGITHSSPRPIQMVLEITERELAARPAELLAAVTRLRAAGWRIALDDVGADAMSLTFLSVLRPDIVKIDMNIVQRSPDAASAELMNALNAYSERTGAILLAEGIETDAHLGTARALGAQLGQGWKFGRPAAEPTSGRPDAAIILPLSITPGAPRSPFECLPAGSTIRESTKALLIEVSTHLERQAMSIGATAVILSSFQRDKYFTGATRDRYRTLATAVGFVAAFGQDLASSPVEGVRGADLDAHDPLCQEWDIVVLSPHFAAALLARDVSLPDHRIPVPESSRRFEFALTYDRDAVTAAAASLMARVHSQQGAARN